MPHPTTRPLQVIVSVTDRAHWDLPGYRCADRVHVGEMPGGAQ